MSAIFSLRICSASCSAVNSSSATDRLPGGDLLGVDLLQARALLETRALALRGICRRNVEQLRGAELLRDRQHPLDQPLEVRARRPDIAPRQIDHLTGQSVPDRAPEVLLDEAIRQQ